LGLIIFHGQRAFLCTTIESVILQLTFTSDVPSPLMVGHSSAMAISSSPIAGSDDGDRGLLSARACTSRVEIGGGLHVAG